MSDSDDLLGKADAFLKRYHPSGAAAQGDVPVLTEVVAEPAATTARPSSGTPAQGGSIGSELPELEQRLKQSILDAIGPHIAKFVEEPLRARLDKVQPDMEAVVSGAATGGVEIELAGARARPGESGLETPRERSGGGLRGGPRPPVSFFQLHGRGPRREF